MGVSVCLSCYREDKEDNQQGPGSSLKGEGRCSRECHKALEHSATLFFISDGQRLYKKRPRDASGAYSIKQ